MSISKKELNDLRDKLAALDLSRAQRRFLDSIQRIAWDLGCSQSSLDAEFDGSFEPEEAEMIMAYQSSAPTSSITRSITRASGTGSITRAVQR